MGSLHLIKLCVGIESLQDLKDWRAARAAAGYRSVVPTRHMPKKAEQLLDGGSLYWVIKGQVLVRQQIEGIELVQGSPQPCRIFLNSDLVETSPQPRRAFQGWRYLDTADAPSDLGSSPGENIPSDLARELRTLGVW
jgi:hypothetical protein